MTNVAIHIDFVSDISCPWCAIGLQSLLQALRQLPAGIAVQLQMQPFELNPLMPPEGQALDAHLQEKYGASPEQSAQMHAQIAARGAALGFAFSPARTHIYNTFDAHRLLHWASVEGPPGAQLALQQALFAAYFSQAQNPSDHAVLLRVAQSVGLDGARAQAVLQGNEFANAVRAREDLFQQRGIRSVPSVIFNERAMLQGGHLPEVFAQALHELAEAARAAGASGAA